MERIKSLRKFALYPEKTICGLALSETHMKRVFLVKAEGIQDIEVIFEDHADFNLV